MKIIIMAGGGGTRFWPWSIKQKPKQFLSLSSKKTMLQQTFERFRNWIPTEKIYVVTTEEYQPLVLEQLSEMNSDRIILEPESKDTGPCIALTALTFLEKEDDEVLVTVPADQHIINEEAFLDSLIEAEKNAKKNHSIVTLGIKPTRAETGYGYIEAINTNDIDRKVLKVKSFIEKPSYQKAEELIQNKNIYWNSGVFVWKPSTIEHYMKACQPQLWNTLINGKSDLKKSYSVLPKISVDYAILEKANEVYTIPVQFEWDDLGTWKALERLHKADQNENILLGNVHTLSTKNCMVLSEDREAIVIGVENLIIVLNENGLLVCHKSQEQKIKQLLSSSLDKTDDQSP